MWIRDRLLHRNVFNIQQIQGWMLFEILIDRELRSSRERNQKNSKINAIKYGWPKNSTEGSTHTFIDCKSKITFLRSQSRQIHIFFLAKRSRISNVRDYDYGRAKLFNLYVNWNEIAQRLANRRWYSDIKDRSHLRWNSVNDRGMKT